MVTGRGAFDEVDPLIFSHDQNSAGRAGQAPGGIVRAAAARPGNRAGRHQSPGRLDIRSCVLIIRWHRGICAGGHTRAPARAVGWHQTLAARPPMLTVPPWSPSFPGVQGPWPVSAPGLHSLPRSATIWPSSALSAEAIRRGSGSAGIDGRKDFSSVPGWRRTLREQDIHIHCLSLDRARPRDKQWNRRRQRAAPEWDRARSYSGACRAAEPRWSAW
jgi:hypothetical protein